MFQLYAILLASLVFALSAADEKIVNFNADITVHADGSAVITEDITVVATGQQIRHGIVREIPTIYFSHGLRYSLGFALTSVSQNNQKASYHTVSASNGIKIYIGDKNHRLTPGNYRYTIVYRVRNVIGFFKAYDELYWNITGNGWRLPIEHAQAAIHFPFNFAQCDPNQCGVWGYTGYSGAQGKDYNSSMQDNTVFIETTKPLKKSQGLTIAIKLPKGNIIERSQLQQWYDFFSDNWPDLVALLGLLVILLIYLIGLCKQYFNSSTVIPLFYPPHNVSAGGVRYLLKQEYDHIGLSADIVQLAVAGCVSIHLESKFDWFTKKQYVLKKESEIARTPEHRILEEMLFKDNDQIVINDAKSKKWQWIFKALTHHYELQYQSFFQKPRLIFAAAIIATIVLIPIIAMQFFYQSSFAPVMVLLLIGIHAFFFNILKSYTPEGKKLIDEIQGFKLFLLTTEAERLAIIGTPPTKNPQLFETYLPYAIALNIEKQWRAQFAPMFEQMKEQGHPYKARWFAGYPGFYFNSHVFANQLRSVAIPSSGSAPGFRSGSGGGGSSGGGSGGGGGGGW